MIARWLASRTPWQLLWTLAFTNVIGFVDRGIVAGAFGAISHACGLECPRLMFNKNTTAFLAESIEAFISETTGATQTNALQGFLQSGFIVGFSVAIVLFGHLVHRFPPFKLVSCAQLSSRI
jgi:hypothetical protein